MPSRRKLLIAAATLLAGGGSLAYLYRRAEEQDGISRRKRGQSMANSPNERLEELLAKQQLSSSEMEEFVRLQNKRILEPQTKEFTSKHHFSNTDMAGRLLAIEWFARCGQPVKLDLTMPVLQVANWEEASNNCSGLEWENATLAASNQLSGWLHVHAHAEFQKWNDHVDDTNAIMRPVAERAWDPFVQKNGLDRRILIDLRWNVGGAMMENIYLDHRHHCFFSLELFTVYEAGHFPCGWIGEWPEGKLLVY